MRASLFSAREHRDIAGEKKFCGRSGNLPADQETREVNMEGNL
jgi:hypothetical protein